MSNDNRANIPGALAKAGKSTVVGKSIPARRRKRRTTKKK